MSNSNAFRAAIDRSGATRSVFLASSYRSGSTYLGRSLLNRTGMPLHLERFNHVPTWFKLSGSDLDRALQRALSATEQGLYGTKIFWPHRNTLTRFLGLDPRGTGLFGYFPDPCVIFLTRTHKAAQAVSFHVARSLDAWSGAQEKQVSPGDVAYCFATIHKYYLAFLSHDALWQDHIAKLDCKVVTVSYEDLRADNGACVSDLSGRLDLPTYQGDPETPPLQNDALQEVKARLLDRFRDDLHRHAELEFLPTRLIGPPGVF